MEPFDDEPGFGADLGDSREPRRELGGDRDRPLDLELKAGAVELARLGEVVALGGELGRGRGYDGVITPPREA